MVLHDYNSNTPALERLNQEDNHKTKVSLKKILRLIPDQPKLLSETIAQKKERQVYCMYEMVVFSPAVLWTLETCNAYPRYTEIFLSFFLLITKEKTHNKIVEKQINLSISDQTFHRLCLAVSNFLFDFSMTYRQEWELFGQKVNVQTCFTICCHIRDVIPPQNSLFFFIKI